MCRVLPSRVVGLAGLRADVEMANGQRLAVDAQLKPEVRVGEYVLVDRGMIVETIEEEEAQAVLAMYAEMDALLDAEDAPA